MLTPTQIVRARLAAGEEPTPDEVAALLNSDPVARWAFIAGIETALAAASEPISVRPLTA